MKAPARAAGNVNDWAVRKAGLASAQLGAIHLSAMLPCELLPPCQLLG